MTLTFGPTTSHGEDKSLRKAIAKTEATVHATVREDRTSPVILCRQDTSQSPITILNSQMHPHTHVTSCESGIQPRALLLPSRPQPDAGEEGGPDQEEGGEDQQGPRGVGVVVPCHRACSTTTAVCYYCIHCTPPAVATGGCEDTLSRSPPLAAVIFLLKHRCEGMHMRQAQAVLRATKSRAIRQTDCVPTSAHGASVSWGRATILSIEHGTMPRRWAGRGCFHWAVASVRRLFNSIAAMAGRKPRTVAWLARGSGPSNPVSVKHAFCHAL
jgi:hypothetical protein